MFKGILGLTVLLAVSPSVTFSQSGGPPKQAIDITAAEIQTVMKNKPPNRNDQQIRVVDMGKYNLGVGIIHRGPTKEKVGDPAPGVIHYQTTETYIILSGSGTLVTGGNMTDQKTVVPGSLGYTVLNGPGATGTVRDGYSRKVAPGDVIIIPPGVFHGWTGIADHVDYLSVRPDPDKVLQSGYINPSLKK